ncbi:sigma-54 dependent transcriptional regulator [Methylonatrum kenyense]|uniref:sigma-54 dependent transcriptional regulator n=1 Tax=Methylonatrum kenyense TaxID=455253 RepID=UPI0020C0541D|nr:sigma-54 dependent transcriptional regulator [Methylonatrum kenyense]MCK8516025.1 sigma-54 dependent transcriptional regulator [Methylonatrum kenyense]
MSPDSAGHDSSVATRTALYVGGDERAAARLQSILSNGWTIQSATTESVLREKLNNSDVSVGLVEPFRSDPSILDALDRGAFLTDEIEWIALVLPEELDDPQVRRLISKSFYDFHTLPVDADRLAVALGRADGMIKLRRGESRREPKTLTLVGRSRRMRELNKQIHKAANNGAPVLVRGESGTGKELAAQAIHAESDRAREPLVVVNCGALPSGLVQSELFGHERGAFTGADRRNIGRIEAADGGTLFLDEIGDLPLDQQVNLLRFLETSSVQRLGSTRSIRVDTRIIAATHVDLTAAVEAGRFREDLFYRLNVLELTLPALRERNTDILLLAHYFFRRFRCDADRPLRGFSARAEEAMLSHDWPGNVRELLNRIRRAIVMSENRVLQPIDLGLDDDGYDEMPTLQQVREKAERDAIRLTLSYTQNNVSRTARLLGISRLTLYRMLDRYRLRPR